MQELLLSIWERNRLSVLFVTHDIDKAIFLADRICVLATKPGRVREVIDVPLQRPRNFGQQMESEFLALKQHVRSLIYDEAARNPGLLPFSSDCRPKVSTTSAEIAATRGPVANRSVTRALRMLELLGHAEDAISLAAVATQLNVPKSSALTLLRALVAAEFCVVDNQGRYALGVRSFEVGAAYLRSMTPVRSVTPGACADSPRPSGSHRTSQSSTATR